MAKIPVNDTPAAAEEPVEPVEQVAPVESTTSTVPAPAVVPVVPVIMVARSTAIAAAILGFVLGVLVAGLCWVGVSNTSSNHYEHGRFGSATCVPRAVPLANGGASSGSSSSHGSSSVQGFCFHGSNNGGNGYVTFGGSGFGSSGSGSTTVNPGGPMIPVPTATATPGAATN